LAVAVTITLVGAFTLSAVAVVVAEAFTLLAVAVLSITRDPPTHTQPTPTTDTDLGGPDDR
jgi:hypothetical protein